MRDLAEGQQAVSQTGDAGIFVGSSPDISRYNIVTHTFIVSAIIFLCDLEHICHGTNGDNHCYSLELLMGSELCSLYLACDSNCLITVPKTVDSYNFESNPCLPTLSTNFDSLLM